VREGRDPCGHGAGHLLFLPFLLHLAYFPASYELEGAQALSSGDSETHREDGFPQSPGRGVKIKIPASEGCTPVDLLAHSWYSQGGFCPSTLLPESVLGAPDQGDPCL
jgi:hypothetical protein